MVFETNEHISEETENAIERIHELLVNELDWDTEKFEVVPKDGDIEINHGHFPIGGVIE